MPHTLTWKKNGIIRIFSGNLEPGEILNSNFNIYNDPNFETVRYFINDFTSVTSFSIDSEHTKVFASTDDIIAKTKGKLLIALVATHKEHIALVKSYNKELKNNLFLCKLFKSLKDAKKWVTL